MIRLSLSAPMLVVCLLASTQQSSAALVKMFGTLTTGTGTFDSINPGDDFSLEFNFSEIAPGLGSIDGGTFISLASDLTITGGTLTLIDNGTNDVASFEFETAGPSGTMSVAFLGDGLADNRVTSANLVSLINNSFPKTLSGNFGASGSFTGSAISAVPEPSCAFLLASAAIALASRRRRRQTLVN